jgi:hypothetical protein
MINSKLRVATLCEALFASDLQSSEFPQPRQVRAAVRNAILTLGVRECVLRVAQEFGDHPDSAVRRMLWAREAVSLAYRGGHPDAVGRPRVYRRIPA